MRRRELLRGAGMAFLGGSSFVKALASQQVASRPLALAKQLPDPLIFDDGTRVATHRMWPRRREEILRVAASQMYGTAPLRSAKQKFKILEHEGTFFDGLAVRRQVRIYFEGEDTGPFVDLLLYLPRQRRPAPVVLGINFWGNHTVCSDPAILLSQRWVEDGKNIFMDLSCVRDHRATEACRGIDARRLPIPSLLKRGYGFATFYRGDIDSDTTNSGGTSIRTAYPELQSRGDNFSAIGAWAWALSRAMDYLETDRHVDPRRVAVYGWSRLGKAAVWAAASDSRFAVLLSQESGAGGAKLFRRDVGENIRRLNTVFPYWFCQNFRQYNDHDRELPFDQHLILAAVAPRPVHIASAAEDHLSDPPGEFLTAHLATPVYQFLGYSGLPVEEMPPVNSPVFGRISYHIRPGGHDVTDYDWEQYLHTLAQYL
ncbi:MAG: glucuronyl esterase domain-containing protein [Acidobacteriaceae bacterium]